MVHRGLVTLGGILFGGGWFVAAVYVGVFLVTNGYSQEEIEQNQLTRWVLHVGVGGAAILGAFGAIVTLVSRWFGAGLMLVGGIVSAVGLGIVASRWGAYHGSDVWAILVPLPIVLLLGSLLAWRFRTAPGRREECSELR